MPRGGFDHPQEALEQGWEEPKFVTVERWAKTGYADGRNGNAPWLPYGCDGNTRAAYMDAYERGVGDRINLNK